MSSRPSERSDIMQITPYEIERRGLMPYEGAGGTKILTILVGGDLVMERHEVPGGAVAYSIVERKTRGIYDFVRVQFYK